MNRALSLKAETAFTTDQGERKSRLEREQTRRFEACRGLLQTVAEPGEEVEYIAAAVAPFSIMEFLTTGWIITVLKRCVLVVTDRRLLHVPMSAGGRVKRSIAEVRYAELRSIEVKGLLTGVLELVSASGKKERFSQIRAGEKRKLRALLAGRANPAPAPASEPARRFLCPRCARRWAQEEACPECGLAFKNPRLAFWLALLAPGGGYFYAGHPWLGIVDAFTEVALLVLLLFAAGALLLTQDRDALPLLVVAFVGLGLEKLLSVYHVRHYLLEALPADSTFEPGR